MHLRSSMSLGTTFSFGVYLFVHYYMPLLIKLCKCTFFVYFPSTTNNLRCFWLALNSCFSASTSVGNGFGLRYNIFWQLSSIDIIYLLSIRLIFPSVLPIFYYFPMYCGYSSNIFSEISHYGFYIMLVFTWGY